MRTMTLRLFAVAAALAFAACTTPDAPAQCVHSYYDTLPDGGQGALALVCANECTDEVGPPNFAYHTTIGPFQCAHAGTAELPALAAP